MAELWVKIEKSTPDKPEIFEIAAELDIDPDAVLGKLVRVWCWVDSNSADGHIKSVTHVLIDRLTGHKGFAQAMETCGWLTKTEIPNFHRHLGESAKKRAKDAERKRKSRNVSKGGHTESVTEDGTQSGLEKRREDKNKDIKDMCPQVVTVHDEKNEVAIPKPKKTVKRFIKPTPAEVAQYCQDRKNFVDPEAWINHYESNGWKVGKNPMKDWKAAVRTWEKNNYQTTGNQNAKNNGSTSDHPFLDDGDDSWYTDLIEEHESTIRSENGHRPDEQNVVFDTGVQTSMEEFGQQESRNVSEGIPKPVNFGDA